MTHLPHSRHYLLIEHLCHQKDFAGAPLYKQKPAPSVIRTWSSLVDISMSIERIDAGGATSLFHMRL
jgi:hypothetical protein